MAINPYAPATATGNGTQVDFTFTFPYIARAHIKASINGVLTTAFTFFSASILRFTTAPPNGAVVRIFRETPGDNLVAVIQPGGPIPVAGLNSNFRQSLYYNQETQYDAASQSTAGLQAQITAATNTANTANTTAVAANATSASALAAATAASSFTQAGAGAVTRSVTSRLRDSISVKDFGAVGDGVTDDAAAVQAAINTVETLGGSVLFPPGKYLFGSQVTINRTPVVSGSNYVGERNLLISGYGAEIRTIGAISAFDVRGGFLPNHNCRLEGFTIYHRENTQAVAGIRMVGAALVTCFDISVAVSSSLPAGYAAFSLENLTPSVPDSGCFWCRIEHCTIRPWGGAEGFATYGVKATGAANALTLEGNTFSGAQTHIWLGPHAGQAYMPNSVVIDGNFFEGPTTAIGIELNGGAATYHVSGTRITNNRFEALTTAATFTGTGTTVQLPAYFAGNYADTSVTNYIVNTLNIPIVMLDFVGVGSTMGPASTYNKEGLVVSNWDGAFHALTIDASALGKGLQLRRGSDGLLLGSLTYTNAAGGNGLQLAGEYSPSYRPLTIKGCQGIAARDIAAQNLAGTATFAAATQRVVTLPVAETDANYLIFLEASANQKLWISARSTTTFTVNSDVSSSNTFGWLLIRHL